MTITVIPSRQHLLQTLATMRQLLHSPSCWTKETFARDNRGDPIDEHSDWAACWCLVGATMAAANITAEQPHGDPDLALAGAISHALYVQMRYTLTGETDAILQHITLPEWNDDPSRTHQDVLHLIDSTRARIELAEAWLVTLERGSELDGGDA